MNCSEKIKNSPYGLSRYGDFFRLFLFHRCDLRCHICPGLKLRECEFGIEVFQRKAPASVDGSAKATLHAPSPSRDRVPAAVQSSICMVISVVKLPPSFWAALASPPGLEQPERQTPPARISPRTALYFRFI